MFLCFDFFIYWIYFSLYLVLVLVLVLVWVWVMVLVLFWSWFWSFPYSPLWEMWCRGQPSSWGWGLGSSSTLDLGINFLLINILFKIRLNIILLEISQRNTEIFICCFSYPIDFQWWIYVQMNAIYIYCMTFASFDI